MTGSCIAFMIILLIQRTSSEMIQVTAKMGAKSLCRLLIIWYYEGPSSSVIII